MARGSGRWSTAQLLGNATPFLVLVVFAGLGYRSVLPPAPLSSAVSETEFSAERAAEHLEVIAQEPHPMGSPELAEVRAYLVAEVERLGLAVQLQTTTAPDQFGGGKQVEIVNVVARVPGTSHTKAVVLMAHYDTVPATPGGNDNSAAVAALLETGRALLAGPPLRNDVVLLFTDGEEPAPRFGSPAFVADTARFEDVGLVVNFETNGGSGASLLAETGGSDGWLMAELGAADSHPGAFSFLTETARLLGDIGTDFDAFRNAGAAGLHFAYLRGSSIYHTGADDIEAVDWGSLQHHGTHALGIARHFGDLDLGVAPRLGEAVYFTIQPLFLRYSTVWAVPFAVGVLAISLAGTRVVSRKLGARAVATLRGFGRILGVLLPATVVGTLAWYGVVAARPSLGVVESYLWFGSIVAMSGLAVAKLAPARRLRGVGIVSAWVALAVLTAFTLPGFSYLFVWPALAATILLLWDPAQNAGAQSVRFALMAAPTLLLTVPAIDVFLQFAQPRPGNPDSQLPSAIAVALLLSLLVVALLRAAWPQTGAEARL